MGESEASGDGGNGDGSESRAKEAEEASEPKSKDGDLNAELSEIVKKVWMDKTKEPKEAPIKKVATGAKGPNVTLLEMLEIDCLEPTPRAGRPKLPPGEKERRRVEKGVAMKKALLEQRAKEATSSAVRRGCCIRRRCWRRGARRWCGERGNVMKCNNDEIGVKVGWLR